MSRARAGLFISTICAAHLCAYAGIGQTLAVLREISTSFGISNTSDLTWALAGYGLAISTFTLIAGRLGDTYGYKRILLAGFVWSAIWSAISGTAVYSTHIFFIFSRVFDGMGAALSIPNSLALLGATYSPGKQKAMVFTLVATMAPMGILVGAVSASLFALVWWPLTYWVSAVALLIIAGVGHFTIPDDSTSKGETPATIRNAIPELDIPGAISGVSALVLISFAWNQAPLVGWQEPYLWITLVVGMLIALLFLLIEIYYAHKPLIPFNAISFDVSFILVADACGWSCFGIWASYTWQFVKNIRGTPPLLATAYISPCIIVGCLATASTGFILQRLSTSIVVFISLLGFMLGSVLVATMPAVQTYWTQLFFSVLTVSWAMDTGFPATILALSNAFEKKHQSTAASLAYTVTYYSVFLGLGIARTVEAYVTRGDQSIDTISLAGLGILGCSAFFLKNLWRKKMCCKYHKEQELHQI
ncbi:major facilitator superfamily MFS-1 [Daldinia bambusicola]|nr:major facilitator superfamily MFS-1 [Daldinia bambusicola]